MLYKVYATDCNTGKVVELVRNVISADTPDEAVNAAVSMKIQLKTNNIRLKYYDYYDIASGYEEHKVVKKKINLPEYTINVSKDKLSFVSEDCPKANITYNQIYAVEI